MGLWRKIRGILSTAALWAISWVPIGLVLSVLQLAVLGGLHDFPPGLWLKVAWYYAAWGAISGATFAIAVAVAERNRTVDELSRKRAAAWGALGGGLLPLATTVIALATGHPKAPIALWLASVLFASVMGALSSYANLRLAQRPLAALPTPSDD